MDENVAEKCTDDKPTPEEVVKDRSEETNSFRSDGAGACITSPQQTPRFADPCSALQYLTPECRRDTPSPTRMQSCDDNSSQTTTTTTSPNQSDNRDDDDDEDGADVLYQNPEPPKELIEQDLVDADNIGNTVFSKHWVLSTLLNLLKVVEQKANNGSNDGECTDAVAFVELDEALEDDLCKLWDMSMNQEVVEFLMEYRAVELLAGVIEKSKSPRAIEICVGLFGNMACSAVVCQTLGSNKELVNLILLLLESSDAPTLVETVRMLRVCVSNERPEQWIAVIKKTTHVYDHVLFILQSSTNCDLLKNTAEFIDKLMEVDEDICSQWSSPDLVLAIMEAIKQTGSHASHVLETFLHVLQLISTSLQGVQALASYCGELCVLILGYLTHICTDDIVGVNGRENIIASALCILSAIFVLWENHIHLLQTDYQLFRCTLKILDVVYERHKKLPPTRGTTRYNSVSARKGSSQNNPDGTKSARHDSKEESSFNERENNSNVNTETATDVSVQNEETVVAGSSSSEVRGENKTGRLEDVAGKDADASSSNCGKFQNEEEFAAEMTKMLYEVLQNLLSELVGMLAELPVSEQQDSNGYKKTDDEIDEASDGDNIPKLPMSLVYLDRLCDRVRLEYMLKMLSEVEDKDHVGLLYGVGRKQGLKRLCRIIRETISRNYDAEEEAAETLGD